MNERTQALYIRIRPLVFRRKSEVFHFRFNTLTISLNQGSIFKIRECAQSIPDLEKFLGLVKFRKDATYKSRENY
jgi:hypothetical protein